MPSRLADLARGRIMIRGVTLHGFLDLVVHRTAVHIRAKTEPAMMIWSSRGMRRSEDGAFYPLLPKALLAEPGKYQMSVFGLGLGTPQKLAGTYYALVTDDNRRGLRHPCHGSTL